MPFDEPAMESMRASNAGPSVRILHVLGDSKFGGASLGILRLARYWRLLGWEVAVLATDPNFQEAAAQLDISVIPLDVIWRRIHPLKDLCGLFRLIRFLRSQPYTIVHTHTTKAGFVGRIAARLSSVPIVVHTAHGFAFHEGSSRLRIAFYVLLERFASWFCDKVVTVSDFHAVWGKRLGIAAAEKIQSISNGIPDMPPQAAGRRPAIRDSLDLSRDTLMLLTHGRLAPEKGLEDLLEAIAILRSSATPKFKLFLAGAGPLEEVLRRQVRRLALEDLVSFLGFRKDTHELLIAADLVVLPSWREGLSIALLESMAAGCAIVTTSIGPNREPTRDGKCAWLVPPKCPKKLAAAIETLLKDAELRRHYGALARTAFEETYFLDRMLQGYEQLYRTLLEEKEIAFSVPALQPSHHR
ncbi:MAG: glycosyltransferase family 4 protein [Bryobacteraceae bacterium]|nr:glycosyltransferase family 4 protein [Bryobacteraceae bacterium]MDW8380244.1 glycosyltransferase family 4 protein [Bryobacterales bacterium]